MPRRCAACVLVAVRRRQRERDRLGFDALLRARLHLVERAGEVQDIAERRAVAAIAGDAQVLGLDRRAVREDRRALEAFCSSRTLPGQACSTQRLARRIAEASGSCAPSRARSARGRRRPGAGCRRAGGAAAGSRRAAPRAGSTGPRGTPCSRPPARRSRLVAATTRTSTLMRLHAADALELTAPAPAAGSSPAAPSGMSPISSRNSVPWWAISALPTLRAGGAGEGALLVAEQLVLEQRLRDGRAVDGDERPLGAVRQLVQRRAPSAPCRCRSRRAAARSRRWRAARWMASIVSFNAGSSPSTRGRPKRRW